MEGVVDAAETVALFGVLVADGEGDDCAGEDREDKETEDAGGAGDETGCCEGEVPVTFHILLPSSVDDTAGDTLVGTGLLPWPGETRDEEGVAAAVDEDVPVREADTNADACVWGGCGGLPRPWGADCETKACDLERRLASRSRYENVAELVDGVDDDADEDDDEDNEDGVTVLTLPTSLL